MSAIVKIDSIPIELRRRMLSDLMVRPQVKAGKNSKYTKTKSFPIYSIINDDYVAVPFSYFYQNLNMGYPNVHIIPDKMKAKFAIKLLDRQKAIRPETFQILNTTRSVVLSLFCGYGKSIYSAYLACKIGFKTVIVCHRLIIIDQWGRTILQSCEEAMHTWKKGILELCKSGTKVQLVGATNEIDPEADFYIINAINLPKRAYTDFQACGTVILDEIHCLCTEKFSAGFGVLFPQYLIGLTATPVRSDGQDIVIEQFCGPDAIYRPLRAIFNVYLYNTGFQCKLEKTAAGDLDWNAVLNAQASSKQRNAQIIDIVRYFTMRNILILCKRKNHANILYQGLKKYGVDVDMFMGSTRLVNYECRVLICTYAKGGVGFDAPKLDMLLVASDAEESWMQYLGRIFRREWHMPIVVDMIDKLHTLRKHADTRLGIYKECGGQVKNLVKWFPAFEQWREIWKTDISE